MYSELKLERRENDIFLKKHTAISQKNVGFDHNYKSQVWILMTMKLILLKIVTTLMEIYTLQEHQYQNMSLIFTYFLLAMW